MTRVKNDEISDLGGKSWFRVADHHLIVEEWATALEFVFFSWIVKSGNVLKKVGAFFYFYLILLTNRAYITPIDDVSLTIVCEC